MNRPPVSLPFGLAAALVLAQPALADNLTGRVLDSNGNGVANVDIDVKNLGSGGDPTISNDGTGIDGSFNVTMPPGFYQIIFNPPPPPTTTHLVTKVDDVVVVGTTDLGDVTLLPGVSVAGRAVRTGGAGVAGVNLDVIDKVTGENLDVLNDMTDASGNFIVAVPANRIELRFDATTVAGFTLASRAITMSPNSNTTIPDVLLPPGLVLSGTVQDTHGSSVQDADLDVRDHVTRNKLYTPGDNTDNFGAFSIVIPAGTYDVEICPVPSDLLVGTDVESLVVSANTDLGLLQLLDGIVLTGTVTRFDGSPAPNVDVEVSYTATGASVVLCDDDTDAAGHYLVLVPSGTFDVQFSRGGRMSPFSTTTFTGVVVTGTTFLNAVLPQCPCNAQQSSGPVNPGGTIVPFVADPYGSGLAGSGGIVPSLTATRDAGGGATLHLSGEPGGPAAILILGVEPAVVPFGAGTLLVEPSRSRRIPLRLDDAGRLAWTLPSRLAEAPELFAQVVVVDPALPRGYSLSRGLHLENRR